MFGIGKKKEAGKVATDNEKNESLKEIQFDFEEDDKLPFDDEEGFADEDFPAEPPRSGLRQALSKRTVLLGLLLLLAIGAGGFYYLNMTSEPPPPQPVARVKTKVTVQPAPAPVTVAPAKPTTPAPAATTKPVTPTPVAAAPTKPVAVPAAKMIAAAATPEVKEAVAAPAVRPTATRQPFTLSAGTFVSQKNLREVEKKIRRLGYTPKVKTTYGMVPMTRLLLGVYEPTAAAARSRELSIHLPELFSVKMGNKVALYAGSYQDTDQARRFADKIYQLGIHVDEETASLRMPLKNVSYGSFANRAVAEKAAKRAAAAGLIATVVKR